MLTPLRRVAQVLPLAGPRPAASDWHAEAAADGSKLPTGFPLRGASRFRLPLPAAAASDAVQPGRNGCSPNNNERTCDMSNESNQPSQLSYRIEMDTDGCDEVLTIKTGHKRGRPVVIRYWTGNGVANGLWEWFPK